MTEKTIKPKKILLVSETALCSSLELVCAELTSRQIKVSSPQKINAAIEILKSSEITTVLINAQNNKLEALNLSRDIKEIFRYAVDVFVYIPDASLAEASQFGKYNAQVEDQNTIAEIVNRFKFQDGRKYIIEENVTSIYSLNGGCGSSFITILLAKYLSDFKQNSLVIESSNKNSIKEMLNLNTGLALLSRDKSKEINQVKDYEWLQTFISYSHQIERMSYLNLFNSIQERNQHSKSSIESLQRLAQSFEEIHNSINENTLDCRSNLGSMISSLKLITKDIEGNSFNIFEEIIQLGSKVSSNIFFDISSDISSSLNKQLLNFSKNIIIIFKDSLDIKNEFQKQKEFFESEYNLNVIPVVAPNEYQMKYCQSLNDDAWLEILNEVPVIYPYALEQVTRFIYDQEDIPKNHELMSFAKELLQKLCFPLSQLESRSGKGVLKLLSK